MEPLCARVITLHQILTSAAHLSDESYEEMNTGCNPPLNATTERRHKRQTNGCGPENYLFVICNFILSFDDCIIDITKRNKNELKFKIVFSRISAYLYKSRCFRIERHY